MKVKGHGQARILSPQDLNRLFLEGFLSPRDRALFGLMLHTGCRVSEALALTLPDIQGGFVTFRKSITKGKIATRTIPITSSLQLHLDPHLPSVDHYLFPGRHGRGRLTRNGADWILRQACQRIGLVGVSTHSFRRSTLTTLHNGGIPLRTIQKISGHQSLATLQGYLEVRPDQVAAAVELIGF